MAEMSGAKDKRGERRETGGGSEGADGLVGLVGVLERIVFFNPENFYTVARVAVEGDSAESVTVVGNLVGANPGETLEMRGRWRMNRRFGRQFEVESFTPRLPLTERGAEQFLASGLIKGVGPTYARRIVRKFGRKVFEILDNKPERLLEVEGIGRKRLEVIKRAWRERRHMRDLVMFCRENGISLALARRIFRRYGDQALATLRRNPYQVALDVEGIGFKTADAMAAKLGIAPDSPRRVEAGVVHILQEMTDLGHSFCPRDELLKRAVEILGLKPDRIESALDRLEEQGQVHRETLPDGTAACYLRWMWEWEVEVARMLGRLLSTTRPPLSIDAEREIAEFERKFRFRFAPLQREALRTALAGGVMVITGGPGTGKTTLVRGIIEILDAHGKTILLAAPTGRAAKRLAETTHREAATVHRLLRYKPERGGFLMNEKHPLRADLVIVDESSMMDLALTFHFLRALRPATSLIFVGDADQLPSVGPGNVLGDLIESGVVPVVRLTEIFRQASRSRIVTNAHRINRGEFPLLSRSESHGAGDFYFVERPEPERALDLIKKLVKERIPARFGLDPVADVQVITPMHRGLLGTTHLNAELQELLNPHGENLVIGARRFRVGDKVMQVRNNYDRDIFNGDIGRIVAIDRLNQKLCVDFDGRIVEYDFGETDEIQLSYAISVHKSQGSEYPAVVLPLHPQHYIMLQRNLLYTAVTRARRLVCIVGTRKALGIAVRNDKTQRRHTALAQRLRTEAGA